MNTQLTPKKNNPLNEPESKYEKIVEDKSIYFFNSLDEMAEVNYAQLATLTPEQHLQNAKED